MDIAADPHATDFQRKESAGEVELRARFMNQAAVFDRGTLDTRKDRGPAHRSAADQEITGLQSSDGGDSGHQRPGTDMQAAFRTLPIGPPRDRGGLGRRKVLEDVVARLDVSRPLPTEQEGTVRVPASGVHDDRLAALRGRDPEIVCALCISTSLDDPAPTGHQVDRAGGQAQQPFITSTKPEPWIEAGAALSANRDPDVPCSLRDDEQRDVRIAPRRHEYGTLPSLAWGHEEIVDPARIRGGPEDFDPSDRPADLIGPCAVPPAVRIIREGQTREADCPICEGPAQRHREVVDDVIELGVQIARGKDFSSNPSLDA